MFNHSLRFLTNLDYCKCISDKPTVFLPLSCFTCLSLSIQGINTVKEIFFSLKRSSYQLVSLNLFYSSVGLFHQLTDSYCPLSESSLQPSGLTDACYIYQVSKFTSGTLLTFPFSLSPPLLPFLLLFSLLCCCRASLQPTWAKPPAF